MDMLSGRYGVESVSGPVGITQEIGKAARAGLSTLLYMCVVISMNLGIFNLLPIPAAKITSVISLFINFPPNK